MQRTVKIDFNSPKDRIRPLNGVNLGPKLHNQRNFNENDDYRSLKIPYARLHDVPLFNPGMRLVDIQHIFGNWNADENDPNNYYFKQTDDYIRNCLSVGTQVIYRLGSSIEHSLQNYYSFPPEDYDKWITICTNIIRHYNEGWNNGFSWNIVYWEIWNEPNAKPHQWSGDDVLYFELYARAAKKIKQRFSYVKIGGPALSCPELRTETHEKYTVNFLEYCRKEKAPLDFFSWHCYPSYLERAVKEPMRVRRILDKYGFKQTELHLNEWHYSPNEVWSDYTRRFDTESAAFTTAVLTAWQDTPITMGCFYTANQGLYGIYDMIDRPNKNFFALSFFAELLCHPRRFAAKSSDKNIQVLAGMDEYDKTAILVSAWKISPGRIVIDLSDGKERKYAIRCLDDTSSQPVVQKNQQGSKIILEMSQKSAVYLLIEI